MNETPYTPPIPTPDGTLTNEPAASLDPASWKDAPVVVKSWAYVLMWLQGIGLILGIFANFFSEDPPIEKLVLTVFFIFGLIFIVWQARNLKRRAKIAWNVQIVLSTLGLLAFPLGTVINGYILSNWFKPGTKAWFGMK